jgi:hypothetical protein
VNALPEPPDRAELEDSFPRHVMRAGSLVYRVHRASREPYYFGNDGSGRFDLVGGDQGVCYTALRDEAAFLEVFARSQPVLREQIRARRISEMMLKGDVQLADMTSGQIIGRYGLTLEVSAGSDYEVTQAWASSLFSAGFGGVLYKARHVPGATLESIAFFGKAGVDESVLEVQETRAIGPDILDRMRRNYGFPDPLPSSSL